MKSFLFLILFISSAAFSAEEKIQEEEAIPFKEIFTKIPETTKRGAKTAFQKDALPYWGALAATTGVLYYYDEKISSNVRYHAHNWHISPNYTTSKFGPRFSLLKLPRDLGSLLYFSGDGFIHIAAAGALMATGKITKNNYHYNTGIMILHGLTMTGLYAQLLKRSFGRESPVEKTQPRGTWYPFPSFKHYQSNTAKYDAMPSGHMMTVALTFTVLSSRYTESQIPILAVGGLWIGGLGFQMINNGVHWASDYPLGLALGYLIGRSAVQMNQPKDKTKDPEQSWNIFPSINNGTPMITGMKSF
jgi:membrane-associated phospholipid phosphatase